MCSEKPAIARSVSDADEIVAVAMVSAIASAAAAAEAASAAAATLSSVAAQASSVAWREASADQKECKPFVASTDTLPAKASAESDDSACCAPPSIGSVGSKWASPPDVPRQASPAVVSKPVTATRAPSAAEASSGLSLYEEYMAKR